jgi:hypothetical protein
MKILIAIVALVGLAALGAWLGPDVWRHCELFQSVQSERRDPYRVEARNADYFLAIMERRGWHVAPRSSPQPDRSWDKVLDELKWPRSIQSVIRFYTTDTSKVGLVRWMIVPDSSRLPALQTMMFRKLSGGVIYLNPDGNCIVEESGASMVSLIQEHEGGVAEWLLVDDASFKRIQEKQGRPNKSLQPTPTAVMPPAAQEIMPAVGVAEH